MDEVIRITSSYALDDKLIEFCKSAHQSEDPTSENVEFLDWENRPETLLNQIYKQRIYDDGGYFCVEEDGRFVAGAGYYPHEDDRNIAVAPVRLYIHPEANAFRGIKLLHKVTQSVIEYIKKQDHKCFVFFVNEHNMWRTKRHSDWKTSRGNYVSVFPGQPVKQYEHKVEYKYTPQYAFYVNYENYEKEIITWLEKITL
jgi:hypothetical protein